MQQWTTSAIQPSKQFDFWRETICHSFVPLRPERTSGSYKGSFLGELSSWQSAGIRFARVSGDGQTVYRDEKSITSKDQAVYFLNYQHRGHAALEQSGRRATLEAGSFALLDAMQPFRMEVSDNFDQLSIKIPHTLLSPLLNQLPKALARAVDGQSLEGRLAMKAISSLADEGDLPENNFTQIALENALQLIALSLQRTNLFDTVSYTSKTHRTLEALRVRAIPLMQVKIGSADFSPLEIAQELGVSLRYLQAAFAQSNTSIRQWVLEERLRRCRNDLQKLVRFKSTIASVAYSHGFNDLSYFNRAFKARYGCAPNVLASRE